MNIKEKLENKFLNCKFCSKTFVQPKVLRCRHTFCLPCLEVYVQSGQCFPASRSLYISAWASGGRTLRCPLCRQRTELPIGGCSRLPDDRLAIRMMGMVDRPSSSSTDRSTRSRTNSVATDSGESQMQLSPNSEQSSLSNNYQAQPFRQPTITTQNRTTLCDICRSEEACRLAVFHCLDCAKMLCYKCEISHSRGAVTEKHTLIRPEKLTELMCREHGQDEPFRFFCTTCSVCICLLCTFQSKHTGHSIVSLREGLSKIRQLLDDGLQECASKLKYLREIADCVGECERNISEVTNTINATAMEFMGNLRKSQENLLASINEAYGKETQRLISEKVELKSKISALSRLCSEGIETGGLHGNNDFDADKLPFEVLEKNGERVKQIQQFRNIGVPEIDTERLKTRFSFRRGSIDLGAVVPMNANYQRSDSVSSLPAFTDAGCQAEELMNVSLTKIDPNSTEYLNRCESVQVNIVQEPVKRKPYENMSFYSDGICDMNLEISPKNLFKSSSKNSIIIEKRFYNNSEPPRNIYENLSNISNLNYPMWPPSEPFGWICSSEKSKDKQVKPLVHYSDNVSKQLYRSTKSLVIKR